MFFKSFKEDIDSFMARDPAARTRLEVLLCYPGFHALLLHRLGHGLWRRGFRLPARMVSQISRLLTSIEIHPGARIGKRLFIDHGAGVVIGETSDIGDNVTIYQGVTLGGISPAVDSRAQVDQKRHPTLMDNVIIGSGAQVLGPITIAKGARIGANAVVHKDVAEGVTAVGIPAREVPPRVKTRSDEFVAYGEPPEGCPDPMLQTVDGLCRRIAAMARRIEQLEAKEEHRAKSGRPKKKAPRKQTKRRGAGRS